MHMKKNILYTLALLSIFASCAKTELPHFGGENDPNAVVISPSVAVLSSKSNPLSEDDMQLRSFNEGDVITIKDLSDNEVYNYKLTNGSWKSTDGKCLLWHSESLNIEASYGSKGNEGQGVVDQSDAEKIASADYMTCSVWIPKQPGSNELSFTLERKQALVTVVIASYGDQYNPEGDWISDLKICDLTPYIRDADGNHTDVSNNGTVGYKYSAIVPGGRQLRINYNVRGDRRIVTNPNGNFFCYAGNSYTINLRVGKDKIEVDDISVSDWDSTDWNDAEADIDAPYVTFSANSEQKFSMDFSGFNCNFTLGEGEYFEYSVGGGNWVRFTGSISDVAFGGSNGDLRLRGKSSKGTANDVYSYSNIKFSTADVMVKCTGDIRTLIDYTDYTGVGTSSAKFCSLFHNNTLLTTAPELPALNLAENCYHSMFYGCSSLTEAPELFATNLTEGCYSYMFFSCSKLSKLTMLATAGLDATNCLNSWLDDLTGSGASSRTLTLADQDVYNSIESTLPDNWKSGKATINYQNN